MTLSLEQTGASETWQDKFAMVSAAGSTYDALRRLIVYYIAASRLSTSHRLVSRTRHALRPSTSHRPIYRQTLPAIMPFEELSGADLVFPQTVQTVPFERLDDNNRLNQVIYLIQRLPPYIWRGVVLGKPLDWERRAELYLVLNTWEKGLTGTDEIVFAKAATEAAVCWLRDRLGADSATIM